MIHSVRRVAQATRSGLRRYPRALLDAAFLPQPQGHLAAIADAADRFAHWSDRTRAATWLGHGSILVRHAGKTILMDPVFSHRIGISIAGRTIGLPRLAPLAFALAELPPIDLVLISHAHFDHLDRPTLRRLAGPATTVVTARRTSRLIPKGFRQVIELDWGQAITIDALRIEAIRPRHWGARTALDRARGYNSYVLRDPDGAGVLLAGDTAMTDAFDRLRDLELAVLGIGSYEPWNHAHATPEEAWSMFRGSGARHLLPVHHSTFPLGDEPMHEPMERLRTASAAEVHRVIEPVPASVWFAA